MQVSKTTRDELEVILGDALQRANFGLTMWHAQSTSISPAEKAFLLTAFLGNLLRVTIVEGHEEHAVATLNKMIRGILLDGKTPDPGDNVLHFRKH